jgi:hypothetical protein
MGRLWLCSVRCNLGRNAMPVLKICDLVPGGGCGKLVLEVN